MTTTANHTVTSTCAITDHVTWTMNDALTIDHTPIDKHTVNSRVARWLDAIRAARHRYGPDFVSDGIAHLVTPAGDEDAPGFRPPTFRRIADASCLDERAVRTDCGRLLVHRLITVGRNPRTGETAIRLVVPTASPPPDPSRDLEVLCAWSTSRS